MQRFSCFVALALAACGIAQPTNEELQREVDLLRTRVDRLSQATQGDFERSQEQSHAVGLSFSADALFWKTRADRTLWAVCLSQNNNLNTPINVTRKHQPISWSWGFRIGAGYQLDHDRWNLAAQYTYFHPSGTSKERIPNKEEGAFDLASMHPGIKEALDIKESGPYAKNGRSHVTLDMDYLALKLSRAFCMTSRIDWVPYIGLAAAWIDQKQDKHFTGGTPPLFLKNDSYRVRSSNRFRGGGPLVGLSCYWNMGLGFSLYGDCGGQILAGRFRLSRDEQLNGSPFNRAQMSEKLTQYRPQLFSTLGLAYDAYFNYGSQHFGLRAGWENQVWLGQEAELSYATQSESHFGNLGFSGLTFRAIFAF